MSPIPAPPAAPAVAASAAQAPAPHVITLAHMAFGAVPAGLRIGDAIEWVNDDIFQHTATAREGSFDVILPPKARVRTVLRRAGEIAFYCRYHPGMTGVLTVAE
jgi:plastocyanin